MICTCGVRFHVGEVGRRQRPIGIDAGVGIDLILSHRPHAAQERDFTDAESSYNHRARFLARKRR